METRAERDRRLEAWRRLASGDEAVAGLLARVGEGLSGGDGPTPALVSRLRREHDADLVAAAIDAVTARRKAAGKFRGAVGLWCDPQAVEQATSEAVAAWKARRFTGLPVADLCCGMGGDARALAPVAGERLVVVDRDPVRAWMAGMNARVVAGPARIDEAVADVDSWASDVDLASLAIHLDPARRDERGSRRFDPEACDPPLSTSLRLLRSSRGGAIKLSPGIPVPLPGLGTDEELEFVSERGTLVQAIVWGGGLVRSPGERRATMVEGEAVRTIAGPPTPPPGVPCGESVAMLAVPDPSIERAGLLGLAGLPELAAGLGILGGPVSPLPGLVDGFFRRFEVLDRPPFREEAVRESLRRLGASGARVRTRGESADADRWTKAVRTGVDSGLELDLFLLRLGDHRLALVVRDLR
jgi:hypothetical protein